MVHLTCQCGFDVSDLSFISEKRFDAPLVIEPLLGQRGLFSTGGFPNTQVVGGPQM